MRSFVVLKVVYHTQQPGRGRQAMSFARKFVERKRRTMNETSHKREHRPVMVKFQRDNLDLNLGAREK
jgi:hypothetical protein